MADRKPIELALCITDLDVGGAEKCLVELACRIDRNRFHPVVYSLAPPPTGDDPLLVRRLETAGVRVRFVGVGLIFRFFHARRKLAHWLAEQRPQILQTFMFHANVVGRLAARRARVPMVLSGLRVAEHGSRWHLWLDRLTERRVARHVCVSQAVARFAQTEGGLPPEKLVVIPNSVDLSRYPAAHPVDLRSLGIAADRNVVTYVGRLEYQKGLEWLLESAPSWLGHLPQTDLLVVGKGPHSDRLYQLAHQAGLAERIHFLGWRSDVAEILAASRALVLTSRWEGMPNVVLEAMASGLPVLTTDVEGVGELLATNAEPQMVSFGDTEEFSQKLTALVEDRHLAAELGAANRRRAEERFSVEAMVAAYEELWESLAR